MHPAAAYWNHGVENVPVMTGAASLLDGADILSLANELGIKLPFDSVCDVGCGTGRLAAFAPNYAGFDISNDCVEYCRARGLTAYTISKPRDIFLFIRAASWVTCLSVFTHIGIEERLEYLSVFPDMAPRLL